MSHYNRNTGTQRSAVIDYERQFQEDLERAQALSLESLALEKFKLQKQRSEFSNIQQQCNPQSDIQSGNSTIHNSSSERDNAPQVEKFQSRSRPRPGSFNTNQSKNAVILAPPPVPSRRNSTTATTSQEHTIDLINFTSPVKQDNLSDYCSPPPPPP